MKITVKIPETTPDGKELAPLEAIVESGEVVAYLPPCGGNRWPTIYLRSGRSLSVLEPPETFFSDAVAPEVTPEEIVMDVRRLRADVCFLKARLVAEPEQAQRFRKWIQDLEDEILRISDPAGWANRHATKTVPEEGRLPGEEK